MQKQSKTKKSNDKVILITVGISLLIGIVVSILIGNFFFLAGMLAMSVAIGMIIVLFISRKHKQEAGESSGLGVFVLISLIMLTLAGFMFANSANDLNTYVSAAVYNARIGAPAGFLDQTDAQGEKYAVYDMDRKLFLAHCLPSSLRAETSGEIGAVFIVTTEAKQSTSYSDGTIGYKYVATIQLKSLKTGEILGTETVSGDPPPSTVRGGQFWGVYGSKPTEEDIGGACQRLLNRLDSTDQPRIS